MCPSPCLRPWRGTCALARGVSSYRTRHRRTYRLRVGISRRPWEWTSPGASPAPVCGLLSGHFRTRWKRPRPRAAFPRATRSFPTPTARRPSPHSSWARCWRRCRPSRPPCPPPRPSPSVADGAAKSVVSLKRDCTNGLTTWRPKTCRIFSGNRQIENRRSRYYLLCDGMSNSLVLRARFVWSIRAFRELMTAPARHCHSTADTPTENRDPTLLWDS